MSSLDRTPSKGPAGAIQEGGSSFAQQRVRRVRAQFSHEGAFKYICFCTSRARLTHSAPSRRAQRPMEPVPPEEHQSPGAERGPSDGALHTSAAPTTHPGTAPVSRVMPRVLGAEVRHQGQDLGGSPDVVGIHHGPLAHD
jgi:hypothetical protein